MHFTNLSAALLGLAAFASAVPHQLEAGNVEQSLTWMPRSLMARGNDKGKNKDNGNHKESLTIIDTTIVKLTEESKNSEVELTVLVEKKIREEREKKKAKDNVRKNHYRNKNKDVNTVIIVITEVIDIRESDKQNKRYLRHELRADNNQKQDVTIQVTEVKAITISKDDKGRDKASGKNDGKDSQTKAHNDDKAKHGSGATAASDAAAAAIQTLDPNSPYASTNQTVLLPSGVAAPSAPQTGSDPAAILEDNTDGLYVQGTS